MDFFIDFVGVDMGINFWWLREPFDRLRSHLSHRIFVVRLNYPLPENLPEYVRRAIKDNKELPTNPLPEAVPEFLSNGGP